MKTSLIIPLVLFISFAFSACVTPKIAGGLGYTAHLDNNSTGLNFQIQYYGGFAEDTEGFTDHLEGSFATEYQLGIGTNGQSYFNLKPTFTYHFKEDEPLESGPSAGIYGLYGFGNNRSYYSFGLTGGYRVNVNDKIFLDLNTDQGLGSQGFDGGLRNGVFHSGYRFNVGFRF